MHVRVSAATLIGPIQSVVHRENANGFDAQCGSALCTRPVSLTFVMASTSKQYKAIGEDIWKGRTEKIVSRYTGCLPSVSGVRRLTPDIERRAVCAHVRRACGAAHSGL